MDEFLDQCLVLTFTHNIRLIILLDIDSNDGPKAAEYFSTDGWSRGATWC